MASMRSRPTPPNGGFHQRGGIADVVLYVLHKHGRRGQWVQLNEHLRSFGIDHPAEVNRALKWLLEEPRAFIQADPDPRAEKYGDWDG